MSSTERPVLSVWVNFAVVAVASASATTDGISIAIVARKSVEQAADHIARPGGNGFCGTAQQRGQWRDSHDGKHKQKRVRFGLEYLCGQNHRHERNGQSNGLFRISLSKGVTLISSPENWLNPAAALGSRSLGPRAVVTQSLVAHTSASHDRNGHDGYRPKQGNGNNSRVCGTIGCGN